MPPPSDRELLRSIYRRLDLKGLLADHPGLTREAVVDLFRRLSAPPEPRGKIAPARRAAAAAPDEKGARPPKPGRLILCTDGGSRGNPGPAGFGAVLLDDSGRVVRELSEFIGRATCNEAEYRALIAALEAARELGARDLLIRADSQLLVRQLGGQYKVRSRSLMPLVLRARRMLEEFASWEAEHVPREMNSRADALANEAMDRGASPAG
ncbi:MAG: ribonuclease HI family protein [Candidatus Brocadiia bacterium]